MIVDWFRNCKKIEETHLLSDEDPSDNKIRFRQEIVYVNYLLHVKNFTEQEAFDDWCAIQNGVASLFKDDKEQLNIEFRRILNKGQKNKYTKLNYKAELKPITIYQQEVDFLNSLNVPVWIKQYWGCLLFYYKFERQNVKRVEKSPTLNAWCIRHTEYKRKNYGGNCQDIIARHKMNLSQEVIQDFVKLGRDTYPSYVPAFKQKKGKVYKKYSVIDEIDDFLLSIVPNTKVCANCGKTFVVSSKSKRKLCDECYKEYIRVKDRARKKAIPEEKGNLL